MRVVSPFALGEEKRKVKIEDSSCCAKRHWRSSGTTPGVAAARNRPLPGSAAPVRGLRAVRGLSARKAHSNTCCSRVFPSAAKRRMIERIGEREREREREESLLARMPRIVPLATST